MVALAVKLARAGQVKPSLVVLGHCLVEQRALGVPRVVALGLTGSGHAYCANTQYCASTACACHHPACNKFAYELSEDVLRVSKTNRITKFFGTTGAWIYTKTLPNERAPAQKQNNPNALFGIVLCGMFELSRRCVLGSSTCSPKVMVPRQMGVTCKSDWPS